MLALFEILYSTNIYWGKVRDSYAEDKSSAVPDRPAARPKPAQAILNLTVLLGEQRL